MKLTERYLQQRGNGPLIAYDYSPPRSADLSFVKSLEMVDAEFVCVAYAPGKSVRLGSMVAAATIKNHGRQDAIFNMSTRDMNKLAIQTHLLEAQALGLENVLVVRGDDFNEKELTRLKVVNDYRPTELMEAIGAMNAGIDFKGLKLRLPTDFCIGAIVDLSRDLSREVRLARRKIEAGARFFITQSVFSGTEVKAFLDRYAEEASRPLDIPVLYGISILVKQGVVFGPVPPRTVRELEQGRTGMDIALEVHESLAAVGCDAFYVIPPILKGGSRDDETGAAFITAIKRGG